MKEHRRDQSPVLMALPEIGHDRAHLDENVVVLQRAAEPFEHHDDGDHGEKRGGDG